VAGVSIGKLLQVLAALDECSEALSDALRATALQVPVVAIWVRKRRNSTWLLYQLSRLRQDFWHSTCAGRLARSVQRITWPDGLTVVISRLRLLRGFVLWPGYSNYPRPAYYKDSFRPMLNYFLFAREKSRPAA
jgi:hypothetical protein